MHDGGRTTINNRTWRRTYRRTGPERTGVPNGGRVAEGQSSEGQRHHGSSEQQLQQAEGEQRPSGQQPRPAARHPRRSGQAAGSIPIRRLAVRRSSGNRTAGSRQHHRQRHSHRLEGNPRMCGISARKGLCSRTAGWVPLPSWWAVLNNTLTERHRCWAHFHIVWQPVQSVRTGEGQKQPATVGHVSSSSANQRNVFPSLQAAIHLSLTGLRAWFLLSIQKVLFPVWKHVILAAPRFIRTF